jgi:hypothetical protein
MAKELPYFRFTSQEWQNGLISLESYHLKGLFIDICSYYWVQNCSITKAMLGKKFSNDKTELNELVKLGILKVDKNDNVSIDFLDEQFDALSNLRKKRQLAGKKGGKQKSSNAKAKLKQNSSYKDKDKDKDNIPAYEDFKSYALSKEENVNLEALKFKYDAWVENGWRNGNDKEIKNWKTSLLHTLPHLPKQPKKVRDLDQEFYENVMKQVNANK